MAKQNPTNEQIEMTMRLVDKKRALKLLWGERYEEKMAPVISLVKEIMERENTKALPTVLAMLKELKKSNRCDRLSEVREAALLAAAVEIIQEK